LLLLLTLAGNAKNVAEPHCPGNAAGIRFRLVQRSRIIVPVVINRTGPYEFLLDTGTGSTIVDPLLTELHLKTRGPAEVVGVGFGTHASFAYLDSLEVGEPRGNPGTDEK
jgi:hypothetical protein